MVVTLISVDFLTFRYSLLMVTVVPRFRCKYFPHDIFYAHHLLDVYIIVRVKRKFVNHIANCLGEMSSVLV